MRTWVPETIKAGIPYNVAVEFQTDTDGPPKISQACFFWSGLRGIYREGPFCFRVAVVKPDPLEIFRVQLIPRNPNIYTLDGYAEYLRDGRAQKSNEVAQLLRPANPQTVILACAPVSL